MNIQNSIYYQQCKNDKSEFQIFKSLVRDFCNDHFINNVTSPAFIALFNATYQYNLEGFDWYLSNRVSVKKKTEIYNFIEKNKSL